jgi:subtilase family serine protease
LPDVSYNAAVLHGVLTFLDLCPAALICPVPPGFYLVGGTSAGSPQWSAITAIADQKNGTDLGFINRALYYIGQAASHDAASFHDITVGNNGFEGVPGFGAGQGWDPASGSGSPKTPGLVDQLIQLVSPGDATAAIAQSATQTNNSGQGHVTPH